MTDRDYNELARDAAEYIGLVQPRLDKLQALEKEAAQAAAGRTRFVKRAAEAVEAMKGSGLVSGGDAASLLEKVSNDPSLAWDIVEKVAKAVSPSDLGRRSSEKASTAPQDPWLREFGGYNNNGATGVID